MKKAALAALICFWGSVLASEALAKPVKRFDETTQTCRFFTLEGNMTGYKVFHETCKQCHSRESGKATFLFTESKTSKGWNRVFAEKYPKCAKDGSWKNVSADDLLKLNDYLYENALGTYNATTDCG